MGFSEAVSFRVNLKEMQFSIDVCLATYSLRDSLLFDSLSIKVYVTSKLEMSASSSELSSFKRKDLTKHKVLKLLKRSGSQCKYTAEY